MTVPSPSIGKPPTSIVVDDDDLWRPTPNPRRAVHRQFAESSSPSAAERWSPTAPEIAQETLRVLR